MRRCPVESRRDLRPASWGGWRTDMPALGLCLIRSIRAHPRPSAVRSAGQQRDAHGKLDRTRTLGSGKDRGWAQMGADRDGQPGVARLTKRRRR